MSLLFQEETVWLSFVSACILSHLLSLPPLFILPKSATTASYQVRVLIISQRQLVCDVAAIVRGED
jgi:hypothetical protein